MEGRAAAPAAGTVLNALSTGYGSAFAIDAHTTATVELTDPSHGSSAAKATGGTADASAGDGTRPVTGEVAGVPDADTRLIERCVELVVAEYGDGRGSGGGDARGSDDGPGGGNARGSDDGPGGGDGRDWHVRTESEVPMAAGLKSSSAAANATIVASLSALGVAVTDDPAEADGTETVLREDAARLGVRAAREVGVTATGAFDDASASMLGGVTLTDNREDELLARDVVDWDVLVWTPPERAYSADADVGRCERVSPLADLAHELALDGRYGRAMTVNGFAFCAALDFPTEPLVEALPDAAGVSLSGTGPSVTAVGDRSTLAAIRETWDEREGDTWLTTTETTGTRTT